MTDVRGQMSEDRVLNLEVRNIRLQDLDFGSVVNLAGSIDVVAVAGLSGRSITRRLVAEAEYLRSSASVERGKREGGY